MKKIFNIALVLLATAAVFSSCKKEEGYKYEKNTQVSVTKSDIIFDAKGGTGSITVAANGSFTAECKSDWCTTSVSGNIITVTAPEYKGLDGRSAAINITCNGQTVRITAQQSAMVFSFIDRQIDVPMAGAEFTISGKSTYDIEVLADDWIQYEAVEGGYALKVGVNTSGDNRQGYFIVQSGEAYAIYLINQAFDRDFSGTYALSCAAGTATVNIKMKSGEEDTYIVSGMPYCDDFEMFYDVSKNLLCIPNGTYVGQHTDGNYKYICVSYSTLDGASGYYSVSTSTNYWIWFDFSFDGKYTITLYDSAKWFNQDRLSQGFTVYTFTTAPDVALATANRKSSIVAIKQPISLVQQ